MYIHFIRYKKQILIIDIFLHKSFQVVMLNKNFLTNICLQVSITGIIDPRSNRNKSDEHERLSAAP